MTKDPKIPEDSEFITNIGLSINTTSQNSTNADKTVVLDLPEDPRGT